MLILSNRRIRSSRYRTAAQFREALASRSHLIVSLSSFMDESTANWRIVILPSPYLSRELGG